MNTLRITRTVLGLFVLTSLVAIGCGDDSSDSPPPPPADGGTDAGGEDSGMVDSDCTRYCDAVLAACTGDDAQYEGRSDCESYCMGAGWPVGTEGEMTNNTIECRIYHAGVALDDPGTHCPHSGPSGADVCGSLTTRNNDPAMYTRVDRMGMPAVSTALIGSGMKDAYNDGDPADDGDFVAELAANNTGLHAALDDDLTGAGLTPCSMTDMVGGLPECFGQEVAAGVSVASLVVPDTLRIDPGAAAGFPNGRALPDPVMDVTLSIILLELGSGTCGGAPCSATSLVGTNPTANDVNGGEFLTEFPYLHPPVTP